MFFLYHTSKHKNMQFSFEKEQDQNILILDVLVTNDEAVIQTSVYCKKIDRFIYKFSNFHHTVNKKNLLKHLIACLNFVTIVSYFSKKFVRLIRK